MLVFDVETLGTESTAIILSAAILYVDPKAMHTLESLYSNTLFVKFKVKEQGELYKRSTDKDSIIWWNKQCDIVKEQSFLPKKTDLTAKEGIAAIKNYISSHCDKEHTIIWTRGSLDQVTIDSLCKSCGEELIMPYSNYRDVRTYVDLVATNSVRGYCSIDKEKVPDYDYNKIMKHNPIDDVVLDALMILYPE